jgi:glutamate N-acetyltransferase/amino-acid N-acetyltransferase
VSITAPLGFVAAGVACGIKASGAPDLALVAATSGAVPAAGVFTANRAAAAPVQVSRAHLAASAGHAAAVVLSSGNANAATGAAGVAGARRMCELVGKGLGVSPTEVLVCQTGLIGVPLPMVPVEAGIPVLVEARLAGPYAGGRAATAIMTTDTVRKEVTGGGHARPQHGDHVGRAHDRCTV